MSGDNHSGIIWCLGPLVVLTLSGVFLSLLVDKRHDKIRAGSIQANEYDTNVSIMLELSASLDSKRKRHALLVSRAADAVSGMKSEVDLQKLIRDGISSMGSDKTMLIRSIRDSETEFLAYQERYRRVVWASAAGERLGTLFTKSGRQFEKVVITRVTNVGFDISHAHGVAKVDYLDLGIELRERFQWVENERGRILSIQPQLSMGLDKRIDAGTSAKDTKSAPKDNDIAALRAEIKLWRNRISALRIEHSSAERQNRHGRNRSVPGSLRTWEEQAALLKQDITRFEAGLALAIEKLRSLSPADAALVVPK